MHFAIYIYMCVCVNRALTYRYTTIHERVVLAGFAGEQPAAFPQVPAIKGHQAPWRAVQIGNLNNGQPWPTNRFRNIVEVEVHEKITKSCGAPPQ